VDKNAPVDVKPTPEQVASGKLPITIEEKKALRRLYPDQVREFLHKTAEHFHFLNKTADGQMCLVPVAKVEAELGNPTPTDEPNDQPAPQGTKKIAVAQGLKPAP